MEGHNGFLACGTALLLVGAASAATLLGEGTRSPCVLTSLALPIGIGFLWHGIRLRNEADEAD